MHLLTLSHLCKKSIRLLGENTVYDIKLYQHKFSGTILTFPSNYLKFISRKYTLQGCGFKNFPGVICHGRIYPYSKKLGFLKAVKVAVLKLSVLYKLDNFWRFYSNSRKNVNCVHADLCHILCSPIVPLFVLSAKTSIFDHLIFILVICVK